MSGSPRRTLDALSGAAQVTRAGALYALWLALLLTFETSPLHAQSNLGQLSEIRGARDKQACSVTGTGIPANPVRVNSGTEWRPLNPAFPREQLRANDRIVVRREVDARVVIDEPTGLSADITLAPKLVCSFIGVDVSAGVPADSGAYALARSSDTVVFTVNRGAAYIRWTDPAKRCLLQVVAQLVRPVVARVCGTRLVVSVDATGNTGYIYVREGTVLVQGIGAVVRATQGELVRLRAQAPPVIADGRMATRVDLDEMDYHARNVWKPGFWHRKSTYLWGAVLGSATAATVIALRTDAKKNVRQTVLVQLPL